MTIVFLIFPACVIQYHGTSWYHVAVPCCGLLWGCHAANEVLQIQTSPGLHVAVTCCDIVYEWHRVTLFMMFYESTSMVAPCIPMISHVILCHPYCIFIFFVSLQDPAWSILILQVISGNIRIYTDKSAYIRLFFSLCYVVLSCDILCWPMMAYVGFACLCIALTGAAVANFILTSHASSLGVHDVSRRFLCSLMLSYDIIWYLMFSCFVTFVLWFLMLFFVILFSWYLVAILCCLCYLVLLCFRSSII